MADFDLPPYLDFLPAELLKQLVQTYEPVDNVDGLRVAPGLRDAFGHIDTEASLRFVCALYEKTKGRLAEVLHQREIDRRFVDAQTQSLIEANADREIGSPDYETVIGQTDAAGRVVVGPPPPKLSPHRDEHAEHPRVEISEFLQGFHVTLFGPPDTAPTNPRWLRSWLKSRARSRAGARTTKTRRRRSWPTSSKPAKT